MKQEPTAASSTWTSEGEKKREREGESKKWLKEHASRLLLVLLDTPLAGHENTSRHTEHSLPASSRQVTSNTSVVLLSSAVAGGSVGYDMR